MKKAIYSAINEWKKHPRFGFYIKSLVIATLVFVAITLSPFRIGIDMQRLLGYESCLPSLVYIIDYRVTRPPRIGDFVVFSFPKTNLNVGPKEGQKAIKKVIAVSGFHVTIKGTELYVQGRHYDRLWLAKSIPGKKPGDFDADYVVPEGYFFAYGTEKVSFDSRYFGPVSNERVLGYARPLF